MSFVLQNEQIRPTPVSDTDLALTEAALKSKVSTSKNNLKDPA
jgi:hypothetical protein